MERRPLIAAAAAALIGTAVVQPLSNDQRVVVVVALAVLCAAATLVRNGSAGFRVCLAVALVGGAANAWLHQAREVPVLATHTTRMRCTVLGDVESQNGASSFLCALDGGPNVLVEAAGRPPQITAHLLLRGRIEPFDEARNPDEPSERALERERGAIGRIASARVLAKLPPGPLTVAIAIACVHGWASAELHQRLGEPAASILAGELWGDRSSLPPDLRTEFQQTGTVHVLVTAGLHLGVVAALAITLLAALRVPRLAACAIAVSLVWLYALISGLHIPAMRAATMLSFALCARACGAKALSANALAAAALVVSMVDPLSVGGASFLLSFACVSAIAAWAEPIAETISEFMALPERIREALTLTLATQLGTWPLTAAIFAIFSPYSVIANLAVVPAVGATMLLGFAQLALAPIAPLAQAVANLNGWLFAWMLASVHAVVSLPYASIPMTPAPAWAIAVYQATIIGGAWCWRAGARTTALAFLAVAATLVIWPPRVTDYRLRITVLDVGQADAIVIQTPRGHTLLVDAGGRLERGAQPQGDSSAQQVGKRIVVPFLLRHGIHELDAIIASHPHGDHVGGFGPVLRVLYVDEFADSGQRYGGYAYNDALQTARTEHVPMAYPRAGAVWRTDDGITLTFIGPSLPLLTNTRNDINSNSLAFILQYRNFRMLFTGDAGAEAEQRFLNEGISLHADILKVGHHGSAYSSTSAFIAAVHPRYAIISVGRHNMFGHPAPSTLATLQHFGAHVYRTDENGAAVITTGGDSIVVTTML
ncbi:MAG: DNA internalization-related competence protein ComEC/Rec2 [Vulcanimicrobiaceae bacterium]